MQTVHPSRQLADFIKQLDCSHQCVRINVTDEKPIISQLQAIGMEVQRIIDPPLPVDFQELAQRRDVVWLTFDTSRSQDIWYFHAEDQNGVLVFKLAWA